MRIQVAHTCFADGSAYFARLCSAQCLEMFLILHLGVRLDLLGTGFEAFGLRLPLVRPRCDFHLNPRHAINSCPSI
jgi:hypothetical protein